MICECCHHRTRKKKRVISLFAHLAGNDEPTVTKTLIYIPRSLSDVAQAFVQGLDLSELTPGRIVSEVAQGNTQARHHHL